VTSLNSQRGIAVLAPPLASFERTILAELSKLTPPASLANDWKQVLASIRVLSENTVKLAAAAKASPTIFSKAERALVSSNLNTRRPMLATAARDGFRECALVL
jgi:hypothetical protein